MNYRLFDNADLNLIISSYNDNTYLTEANLYFQYYQQTDTYKSILHYMNTTLTGLFTLECLMKIFSFGVRVRSN